MDSQQSLRTVGSLQNRSRLQAATWGTIHGPWGAADALGFSLENVTPGRRVSSA